MERAANTCVEGEITVRLLENDDVDTVLTVFHRLGEEARQRWFNGVEPRVNEHALWEFARVDANHRTLVAYVDGVEPAAIARLVQSGKTAEIAVEVAAKHAQRGLGPKLTDELLADARASGVTEVTALVSRNNSASLALLRRALDSSDVAFEGRDLWVTASL